VQSIFIFLVLTWFLFLVFVFPSFRFFHEQQKRVALLMATALLEGASIGPLIDLAIQIDPRYMSLVRFSCVCLYIYRYQTIKSGF
jgi:hypothetical protein